MFPQRQCVRLTSLGLWVILEDLTRRAGTSWNELRHEGSESVNVYSLTRDLLAYGILGFFFAPFPPTGDRLAHAACVASSASTPP